VWEKPHEWCEEATKDDDTGTGIDSWSREEKRRVRRSRGKTKKRYEKQKKRRRKKKKKNTQGWYQKRSS
jgi:hypothetical protein